MSDDEHAPTAEIIAFRRPDNRFTTADRMALANLEARDQSVRLAIHKRRHDDPPEVGEFASIYAANGRWASWGAVRQGRAISVWRSRDGRDIGRFATMSEALEAVTAAALPRR